MAHNLKCTHTLESACEDTGTNWTGGGQKVHGITYFPYVGTDNKVTVIGLQPHDLHGWDRNRFLKNKAGDFIYSEYESDIINFINDEKLFKRDEVDPAYLKNFHNPFNGRI